MLSLLPSELRELLTARERPFRLIIVLTYACTLPLNIYSITGTIAYFLVGISFSLLVILQNEPNFW